MKRLDFFHRVLVSVCLAGLLQGTAWGQDPPPPAGDRQTIYVGAIQFGVEAGGNIAYLATSKGTRRGFGSGLLGGAYAVIPVLATVGIQPELLFSQRHSRLAMNETAGPRLVQVSYDYTTVAILARLKFYGTTYITEGPAFHFPFRGTVDGRDVKDTMKMDISLIVGFGGKVGPVNIEGRWDSGIRLTRTAFIPGEPWQRNRAITALVVFPIKK